MMRLKGLVSVVLVVMLVIGLMVGCGPEETPSTDTSGQQNNQQADNGSENQPPQEVKVMLQQFSGAVVPDQTTPIEKLVEEKLNIKLVKTVVPGDLRIEKRNVLLASASLDIAFAAGLEEMYNFASTGQALDLTDLLPEKAPNYWKTVDDTMKKYMSLKERIYAIIGQSAPRTIGGPGVDTPDTWVRTAVRKDWLEKLDLQPPKTIDEFFNVAKAFYDNDPDKLGKENIIPIVACNGFGWNNLDVAFGAYGVQYNMWYLDQNDDTVKSYDVHPGMKEALTWLNKAYEANLIDKDFLTQKEPQMLDKIKNGRVGFYSAHWYPMYDGGGAVFREMEQIQLIKEGKLKEGEAYKPDTTKEPIYWTIIDAPKGPRGESGYPSRVGYSGAWPNFIPKNAENVDAVLKLIDFLSTEEGYKLVNYGVEGKDFVMTPEGPKPGPSVGSGADDEAWAKYKQEIGAGTVGGLGTLYPEYAKTKEWATYMYGVENTKTKWGGTIGKGWNIQLIDDMGYKFASAKYVDFVSDNALSSASAGQLKARLAAMRDEYFAKFVTGDISLDKWDEYVDEWHKQGGDTLIKEYTEAYKSRK